ncbi:MAG: hypothetical protein Q8L49_02930 [Burkholderiaceae bacterium]|nr:hypothetical protein [Burkholderiaceae bacterium]
MSEAPRLAERKAPLTAAPATPADLPDALWQVRLLGGLEISDGRQRLHRLPSRAAVALLARLAIWPQRAHAREELIECLWPGVELGVGRNRLRQVLSSLKSLLEPAGRAPPQPVLVADRTSVRVVPDGLACDVPHFERQLQAGRCHVAWPTRRFRRMHPHSDAARFSLLKPADWRVQAGGPGEIVISDPRGTAAARVRARIVPARAELASWLQQHYAATEPGLHNVRMLEVDARGPQVARVAFDYGSNVFQGRASVIAVRHGDVATLFVAAAARAEFAQRLPELTRILDSLRFGTVEGGGTALTGFGPETYSYTVAMTGSAQDVFLYWWTSAFTQMLHGDAAQASNATLLADFGSTYAMAASSCRATPRPSRSLNTIANRQRPPLSLAHNLPTAPFSIPD